MQTPFFFQLLLFLFCAAVCQSSLCEDEVILVVLVKKKLNYSRSHKLVSLMSYYLLLLTSVNVPDKQNWGTEAGVPSQKHLSCNPQEVMQLAFRNKHLASHQQLWGVFPLLHTHSTARYSFFFFSPKPLLYNRLQKPSLNNVIKMWSPISVLQHST